MHRMLNAAADLPAGPNDGLLAEAQEMRAGIAHLSSLLHVPASLAPEPATATDLSLLVQEMRRLLRAVTPPELSLRFQLAEQMPLVKAEGVRLRQVLTHLVAAVACKSVMQQWPLTIRTRVLPAPAWLASGGEAPALELVLGSDCGQAVALLRWAVISQGRARAGSMLRAATVQQTLHELHCTVNFVRLPDEGAAAQLLFPQAK